jgi:hypothetical protein
LAGTLAHKNNSGILPKIGSYPTKQQAELFETVGTGTQIKTSTYSRHFLFTV